MRDAVKLQQHLDLFMKLADDAEYQSNLLLHSFALEQELRQHPAGSEGIGDAAQAFQALTRHQAEQQQLHRLQQQVGAGSQLAQGAQAAADPAPIHGVLAKTQATHQSCRVMVLLPAVLLQQVCKLRVRLLYLVQQQQQRCEGQQARALFLRRCSPYLETQ